MQQLLTFPVRRSVAFVLGCGKNSQYLRQANAEKGWFDELVAIEHPRFIMQYRRKYKQPLY